MATDIPLRRARLTRCKPGDLKRRARGPTVPYAYPSAPTLIKYRPRPPKRRSVEGDVQAGRSRVGSRAPVSSCAAACRVGRVARHRRESREHRNKRRARFVAAPRVRRSVGRDYPRSHTKRHERDTKNVRVLFFVPFRVRRVDKFLHAPLTLNSRVCASPPRLTCARPSAAVARTAPEKSSRPRACRAASDSQARP